MLDCSSTDGSATVFVFKAVDLERQDVSDPPTHVWTV